MSLCTFDLKSLNAKETTTTNNSSIALIIRILWPSCGKWFISMTWPKDGFLCKSCACDQQLEDCGLEVWQTFTESLDALWSLDLLSILWVLWSTAQIDVWERGLGSTSVLPCGWNVTEINKWNGHLCYVQSLVGWQNTLSCRLIVFSNVEAVWCNRPQGVFQEAGLK